MLALLLLPLRRRVKEAAEEGRDGRAASPVVGGGRTFDGRAVVNRRLGEEEDGVDGKATAFFRTRRGKKEEEKKRIARKSIAEGRAAALFACGPRARKETGIREIKEFRAGGFRYTGKGGSRPRLRGEDSAARALPHFRAPVQRFARVSGAPRNGRRLIAPVVVFARYRRLLTGRGVVVAVIVAAFSGSTTAPWATRARRARSFPAFGLAPAACLPLLAAAERL